MESMEAGAALPWRMARRAGPQGCKSEMPVTSSQFESAGLVSVSRGWIRSCSDVARVSRAMPRAWRTRTVNQCHNRNPNFSHNPSTRDHHCARQKKTVPKLRQSLSTADMYPSNVFSQTQQILSGIWSHCQHTCLA